jgi:hypothetical protein
MPISPQLSTMLSNYAQRAGVRITIEEVGASPGESILPLAIGLSGIPPIELPDSPAAAVAAIVALDSRYEVSGTGGEFRVRPKEGVPGRLTVLDQTVDGFSASNEPIGDVIVRAGRILGTVRPRPTPPAPRAPTPIDLAMARTISFDLRGTVSVREILDAIARTAGEWTWSVRPTFVPGQNTTLAIGWRGPTWSTSIPLMLNADLTPPPMPSRPPARTIPMDLDRQIARATVSIDPRDPSSAFEELGTVARVAMGIELLPVPRRDPDPRRRTRPVPPLVLGPGRFSDALYIALEKMPEYEILPSRGIVSVAATSLLKLPGHALNTPVDRFTARNEGFFRAVGRLRGMMNPRVEPADWTGPNAATMNRPVTIGLERTTVRDVLNELVRAHGGLMWSARYEGAAPTDTAEARETDLVLTFTPLDNSGPPIRMVPPGRPAAAPDTPMPPMPTMARGAGPGPVRATLDLPATPQRVGLALSQIARSTATPMGVEHVYPQTIGLSRPGSEYYDLTGLSVDEAIEKVLAFAPEYVLSTDRGIRHVRARAVAADPSSWLNRRVAKFEQHFDNLRDAHQMVAGLALVSPRGGVPPPTGPIVAPSSDALRERLATSITISLTDVTIREVLDEIARQHGRLMWSVEHRQSGGAPAGLTLTFAGFDGWSISTSVR